MRIIDEGVIVRGKSGTNSACNTFPALTTLADGTCLLTFRSGTTKDCDDERIRYMRSDDAGSTWKEMPSPFIAPKVQGKRGSLKLCYLTEISPGHLIAAALWVDRESFPNRGLFNEETEGCLPMAILVAESKDTGEHWTPFRMIPMTADIGPPSLTNPILKLASGELLLSVETNKPYEDPGPWKQRVVLFRSTDTGRTWHSPIVVAEDRDRRFFYWDQRASVTSDGRIVVFHWTYDRRENRYLNIHRKLSLDGGRTWSTSAELGFSDQPSHPAITASGKVVLAYVDRFGSMSIRVRLADDIANVFADETELELYHHGGSGKDGRDGEGTDANADTSAAASENPTGELLEEMSQWSFGLPYAEVLPDGNVLVLYYAGTDREMDVRYCRLAI